MSSCNTHYTIKKINRFEQKPCRGTLLFMFWATFIFFTLVSRQLAFLWTCPESRNSSFLGGPPWRSLLVSLCLWFAPRGTETFPRWRKPKDWPRPIRSQGRWLDTAGTERERELTVSPTRGTLLCLVLPLLSDWGKPSGHKVLVKYKIIILGDLIDQNMETKIKIFHQIYLRSRQSL